MIVIICAAGLGLSSLFGSAAGLLFRRIPHKWNDIFLGFCAGMMLAASLVCLILPGFEAVEGLDVWQVVAGVVLGVILVGFLDFVTPPLHNFSGIDPEAHRETSVNKVLLFVMAIAIHKFPEGMATGIALDDNNTGNSLAITLAIALQNIPEGMVIVTPLMVIGVRFLRVAMIALAVALLEIIGVFAGYFLGGISEMFLPALLGLAGGAMLYVISDEMIPETHSHGFQKESTYALVAGVVMMLLIQKFI
ncbi:MAG: ZIP family metal transporter [Muribaculaceae bacterium]|nr:ZIP family metal transporter [Muribaculaceae bacterium]